MEENNNQENSKNDKENSFSDESEENAETTNSKTNDSTNKTNPEKLYWGKFRLADIMQIIGLLLTFATLIVFIFVSTTQINQTERSIKNSIDAINSARKSDSLNQISFDSSLAIANSSLKITSQRYEDIWGQPHYTHGYWAINTKGILMQPIYNDSD